jgi:cyanate lyase
LGKLNFHKLLQAHIDWDGLTYEEVADRLGISSRAFRQKRYGQRQFTFSEAHALASMLDVSLDELWESLHRP